jgi:hypothetical protein
MNNKAQSIGLGVMSFLFILIAGFIMINILMGEVTIARAVLECSSAGTIHDGNKLLCLVADLVIPYWILIILGVAVGAIVARFTL